MMKSFFKKLAFVMALAMVVSAMAPAATAKAAEAKTVDICVQNDNYIARPTYGLTEGAAPVDFCFAGAPDWKNYTWTWDSSDKDVATVDNTGLVTLGTKTGTTTITVKGGDVYTGSMELTVDPKANPLAFEAEMLSDNVAKLTFNDTTVTAADLKNGLEFFYYVAGYPVPVPLVEKIEAKGNGVFHATLYNTVYFENGVVYGFTYKGYTDEFTCVIGEVAFAKLTVNNKDTAVVDLTEDSVSFGAKLYNEAGKDITATALKKGVSVEYEVAEDEDGKFSAVDETSMIFHEEATAVVKVTCFKLDDDAERVVLVNALPYTITAKKPAPYDITFNQAPEFTIVPVGTTSAAGAKWPATNTKLAVGDDGYELLVKLTDNKSKSVGTDGIYYKNDKTQDGAWDEGTFTFTSTNVSRLYITEDGLLMPNAKGEVVVLLYYTSNAEDAEPQLVSAIKLDVQAPRTVGTTSLSTTKKTLSTVAVNKSNETTVTIEVRDSLGDKTGVNGLEAKVECTTTGTALKNGAVAPTLSTAAPKVVDGKITFTISANAETVPVAGKSQIYNYKVTIGSKTETFAITVKAPTSATSFSKFAMIFSDAKIKDATDLNAMKLVVELAGISNGVTAAKLNLVDSKLKAEDAVAGKYYYTVFKDGVDLTEKMKGKVVDGALVVDLTTTKGIEIKETNSASKSALTVVDLVQGAGKYTVTVYEAKTDSKGKVYFNPLSGAKDTYTVAAELPSAAYVGKLAPTYSKTTDVKTAVMDCFKFTVGDKTFDSADDYAGYVIAIDENVVAGGDVCYVNTVTFYKLSKAGAYIACGTVTVGDYITFTAE